MEQVDVIIVGAGPVGLLLAGELALQGVKIRVLERLEEPDSTIKAGSINVASAEILDRRGLLPAAEDVHRRLVTAAGAFADGTNKTMRGLVEAAARRSGRFPVMGHFAAMLFRDDLVDQNDPILAAHTAIANGVLVPQHDVELILAQHCARLGVEISRGVEVTHIHGVSDEYSGAASELVVETNMGDFVTSWVVAADGGRSAIRKQLGIDFVGTPAELVGYQAIADFDDATRLRKGWNWTSRGIYTYGPIPGRILVARFGPQPEDRNAPVTLDELQSAVRDVTGIPVAIKALKGRATRWSDNARQARSYRHGRVLLAGDAAHVHSPFSGQGLNLGLGDAMNLGWKLAATIQGWATEGLLDTYEAERHPIGAWVLDWTRAQVALLRGDERTAQLRKVFAEELLTVPGTMNRLVALSSGILQHFDVADNAVPPVGSLVGDVLLASGGRLADHARDGRFVFIDRSSNGAFAGSMRALERRIAYVADAAADAALQSLLVRPDGIVIWVATRDSGLSEEEARTQLDSAIRRWIGRP